jgi:hypothetical protein
MFELNRTQARWAFKDLLGQANHFLITILVGLDGVRTEKVELSPEFRTSWNPQSISRSADRSRVFVLDLALIRAIDALDTYMMMSARKPSSLSTSDFRAAMDGSRRSVANRFDAFDEHLSALPPQHKAILSIAIEWRNQRVHSLSSDQIEKKTLRVVRDNAEFFKSGYSGLDVDDFISHFKSREAPTFKEAASVIRLTHEAVAHYDAELLQNLPIERYLKEALLKFLKTDNANPLRSIQKTWDHPEKKRIKVIRLLRMIGVNQTDAIKGRLVPDKFVDELVGLKSGEVLGHLQS